VLYRIPTLTCLLQPMTPPRLAMAAAVAAVFSWCIVQSSAQLVVNCRFLGGDTDGDSFCDIFDNCPLVFNVNFTTPGGAFQFQDDADFDGVGDACDDCPNAYDPDQEDIDGNGVGDACDLAQDCSLFVTRMACATSWTPAPPSPTQTRWTLTTTHLATRATTVWTMSTTRAITMTMGSVMLATTAPRMRTLARKIRTKMALEMFATCVRMAMVRGVAVAAGGMTTGRCGETTTTVEPEGATVVAAAQVEVAVAVGAAVAVAVAAPVAVAVAAPALPGA